MSERDELLDPIMLGATRLGGRLFRNNSGVAFHKNGGVVRYGVAPGGSDLIGWMPRKIKTGDVGRTLAIFTAVEAKTGAVPLTAEQHRFLHAVNDAGGFGMMTRDVDHVLDALRALIK